jgi:hypothetical protein
MCSTCFPRSALPVDASLPSAGSSGVSSPVSTVLPKRYDFLPPVPPHFVAFVRRYLSVHSFFSLPDGRVRRRGLELVTRYLRPGLRRGNDRTSQVPGEPRLSVCPCSTPTPAGPRTPDHYSAATWPLVIERQRLLRRVFRRSIAWLSDSLSTLRGLGCPTPRKTRFRPLVRRYRTGFPPARFR